MIRENPDLIDLHKPSVHTLDSSEFSKLFSRCDPMYVNNAKIKLKEGCKILQVYHPNFLLISDLNNLPTIDYYNSCIKDVLESIFLSSDFDDNYFILAFPLIPEDPVVYIVI